MRSRPAMSTRILVRRVLPVLNGNGYVYALNQFVGPSIIGGNHQVDAIVATPRNDVVLVSLDWQRSSRIADKLLPFRVIKLIHALQINPDKYKYAYLVLAGSGWKEGSTFMRWTLHRYINDSNKVHVVPLRQFLLLARHSCL